MTYSKITKQRSIKYRIYITIIGVIIVFFALFFTSVKIKPYSDNEIPFAEFDEYDSRAIFGAQELKLASIQKKFFLYLPTVKKMDILGGNKSYMKFYRKYAWHGFLWDLNFKFESTNALNYATLEVNNSEASNEIVKLYDDIYKKLTEKHGIPQQSSCEDSSYDSAYDWKMTNGTYTVFFDELNYKIKLQYSQNIHI